MHQIRQKLHVEIGAREPGAPEIDRRNRRRHSRERATAVDGSCCSPSRCLGGRRAATVEVRQRVDGPDGATHRGARDEDVEDLAARVPVRVQELLEGRVAGVRLHVLVGLLDPVAEVGPGAEEPARREVLVEPKDTK